MQVERSEYPQIKGAPTTAWIGVNIVAGIIKAKTPVIITVVIGGYVSGLALAALGVYLVVTGDKGATEFSFFGQTFKSTSIGIAAIFLGAVCLVLLIRRALKSLDTFSQLPPQR
jgi:hypothetical protein